MNKKTLHTPLLIVTLLSSCVLVQHEPTNDERRKEDIKNMVFFSQWSQKLNTIQADTTTSLLKLIQQPQLNELVNRAINHNSGLQRTLLASKSAMLSLQRSKSNSSFNMTADFGATQSEQKNGNTLYSYSSGLNISWELDLWKKLADKDQAATYDHLASKQDYLAARASLAANVIKSYLNLATLKKEINIEQRRSKLLKNNQEATVARYRSGLSSLSQLETARSSYAKTMSSLIQLKTTFTQNERDLAVLVGKNTKLDFIISDNIPTVMSILATTPMQTIARRPDIKAALLRIEAEDARTRASYKELLPSFTIGRSLSSSSSSLSSLLFKDPLWNILGGITAPIFNGGKIKTDAKIQKLSAEKSYFYYKEALLIAIQEIENSLENETLLQQQQAYQLQVLESASSTEKYIQTRYQKGLTSYSDLISAKQNRFDAELSLMRNKTNQLSNRITLGLALGIGV